MKWNISALQAVTFCTVGRSEVSWEMSSSANKYIDTEYFSTLLCNYSSKEAPRLNSKIISLLLTTIRVSITIAKLGFTVMIKYPVMSTTN